MKTNKRKRPDLAERVARKLTRVTREYPKCFTVKILGYEDGSWSTRYWAEKIRKAIIVEAARQLRKAGVKGK